MTSPLDTNVKAADPRNYSVAKKASLWFLPAGQVAESKWIEFGNIIDPSLAPALTYIEHYSNRRGARTRDRIEISEVKADFKFKVDEVPASILQKIWGGSGTREASTVTLRDGATLTNPGSGESIEFSAAGVDTVIVRSTNEEGVEVTYEEDPITTDPSEATQGGDFNSVTNPVVVDATDYSGITFAVGMLLKIEDEILRVSQIDGSNVTLQRAQLGTTAATHADSVDIFTSGDKDYVFSETGKAIYILPSGDLADETTVPEVHIHWSKSVETEKFQILDGTPIKGKAQFQILTAKGLRIVATFNAVTITNDGDIAFGDGSKFIETGLQLECLADASGSLGDLHILDAAATF